MASMAAAIAGAAAEGSLLPKATASMPAGSRDSAEGFGLPTRLKTGIRAGVCRFRGQYLRQESAADAVALLVGQDVQLGEVPDVLSLSRDSKADHLIAATCTRGVPTAHGYQEPFGVRGQEMLEHCQEGVQVRRRKRPV